MKMIIKDLLRNSLLKETNITLPKVPNTMNFWHGGNLDDYNDTIAQKNGRYEFGPGLYLITHHDTALKYAKGSRKLYIVTVEMGIDINDATLDVESVLAFIKKYIIPVKKNEIINRLQKHIKEQKIKAFVFNNIILNEKAIKPSNTKMLRQFYIDKGIDYEMVFNPFGWGEKMMVLYNMKKIVNTIVVRPTDNITNDFNNDK